MAVETNAETFGKTWHKYAEIYSARHPEKGLAQIFKERALNLAYKIYQATRTIAPTQAQIASDVQKQGWRIPEKFSDGRLGRGTPDQWMQTSVSALPKKRGRKSKERMSQEAAILGSKPTLQDMQAFVIKHRSAHAGFIASGWLGAIRDLGGKTSGGRFGFAKILGGTEIDIINDAPGCREADAKHNFVQTGVQDATVDMANKITEWLKEQRQLAK